MSWPGIEPVTSRSPEPTFYQLSYRGWLSDVVIKVGGRQIGSVQKLYDHHVTNLHIGGRQLGNSVHRTCMRLACLLPTCLILSICRPPTCQATCIHYYLPTADLSTCLLHIMHPYCYLLLSRFILYVIHYVSDIF